MNRHLCSVAAIFMVLIVVQAGYTSDHFVHRLQRSNTSEAPGRVNKQGERVYGGTKVAPHEFPWLASLTFGNSHFCGGTLLDHRYILTAAHCFKLASRDYYLSYLRVNLGVHDNSRYDRHVKTYMAEAIIVHPDYNTPALANDIAMIKLQRHVKFSHFMKPIKLPRPKSDYVNKKAVVAGWGETEKKIYPSLPIKAHLTVISDKQCKVLEPYSMFDGDLCTLELHKDACQGDSGGPLIYKKRQGEFEIIGVVSRGRECAVATNPGIFSKVTTYLSWIRSVMKQ